MNQELMDEMQEVQPDLWTGERTLLCLSSPESLPVAMPKLWKSIYSGMAGVGKERRQKPNLAAQTVSLVLSPKARPSCRSDEDAKDSAKARHHRTK